MTIRVLLLGGTFEARQLANLLADAAGIEATLSLAGRTRAPLAQRLPVRVGGFGGIAGLRSHIEETAIDILVDATHPFAGQMSAHAVEAARLCGIPLLSLRRPAWTEAAGDRWIRVPDVAAGVAAIGTEPRRVLVALGRQELAPLLAAPQHRYLIRSVDPVDPPLPLDRADYILDRGPFDVESERDLLGRNRIDMILAKNSGGDATYGKIAAARDLGIPVIVVDRPPKLEGVAVESIEAAFAWLSQRAHAASIRGE